MSKEKEEQRNPKAGPYKADMPPPLKAYAVALVEPREYASYIFIRLSGYCCRVFHNDSDNDDYYFKYQHFSSNPENCKNCDFCTGNNEDEFVEILIPANICELLKKYRKVYGEVKNLHDELSEKYDDENIDNDELIKIRREYFEKRNEKYRLLAELDVIFTLPKLE